MSNGSAIHLSYYGYVTATVLAQDRMHVILLNNCYDKFLMLERTEYRVGYC